MYQAELKSKIEDIKLICAMHKLPMFITVCTKNNEEESIYMTEVVGSFSNGVQLKDDRIPKHINVMNGFDTILKSIDAVDEIEL